jgi:hypothetical protein
MLIIAAMPVGSQEDVSRRPPPIGVNASSLLNAAISVLLRAADPGGIFKVD